MLGVRRIGRLRMVGGIMIETWMRWKMEERDIVVRLALEDVDKVC